MASSRSKPTEAAAPNRRASREAIEKRRAARKFNEVLAGTGPGPAKRDGRTEKRRQRLLRELSAGAQSGGQRDLKPIDVLQRVQQLLELGEPLASIRKARKPPRLVPSTPELVEGVRSLHEAYGFAVEVYRFVGVDDEVLRKAGVLGRPGLARSAGGASREEGAA